MMEVTSQLENRGLEVSDLIFLDCIFTGKGSEQSAKPMKQQVMSQVAETLNQMGVSFLKDWVVKKIEKYMAFEASKTDLEVVQANIHLILSEETGNSPLSRCWDRYTTKKSLLYRGFGRHSEMLSPGFLERNAQLIREILENLEVESG